jgi:hypothetical protein
VQCFASISPRHETKSVKPESSVEVSLPSISRTSVSRTTPGHSGKAFLPGFYRESEQETRQRNLPTSRATSRLEQHSGGVTCCESHCYQEGAFRDLQKLYSRIPNRSQTQDESCCIGFVCHDPSLWIDGMQFRKNQATDSSGSLD